MPPGPMQPRDEPSERCPGESEPGFSGTSNCLRGGNCRGLSLPTRDSKTVAFSPEGTLLAALTSDDQLNVWRFDAAKGKAEPLVTVSAVPMVHVKVAQRNPRQAQWIDWIDSTRLGIATSAGAILILSFDQQNWAVRLNALARDKVDGISP
jgi:hypothetical protein